VETALIPLRGFYGDMMGFHGELMGLEATGDGNLILKVGIHFNQLEWGCLPRTLGILKRIKQKNS